MTTNTRRPKLAFREDDTPMDKWNARFDRRRGMIALFVSIFSILSIIGSGLAVMRTNLGYATTGPGQRLGKVEARLDTITAQVQEIREQARPLLINLCFEASDTVLALIQDDISCRELIPRRVGRGR